MDSSQVISKLEADGWKLDRIKGSHHYFKKPGFPRPACVPHPKKDLPAGTIAALQRYTGVRFK